MRNKYLPKKKLNRKILNLNRNRTEFQFADKINMFSSVFSKINNFLRL